MHGILEITLNGNKERLRFNNYARNELRRFFAPDTGYLTEGELMQAIIDKWKENEHLLLKMLVYAGIVGDSLIYGFKSRLSQEEIGEYIGSAPDSELIEVWKAFLDSQGINLSPEEPIDEKKQAEEEKKRKEEEAKMTPEEKEQKRAEEKKKTKIT